MPRRRARDGSRRPRNGSPDHADLRESDSPRFLDVPARHARPDSPGRATLHRDRPLPLPRRRGRQSHEGLLRHRAGHPLRGVRRCDRGRHGRLGGPDENRRRCYLRPRAARGPASGRGPRGSSREARGILGVSAERAVWRTTRRGIGPSGFPGLGPERGEPPGALRRTASASVPGTLGRTFGRRRGLRERRRRSRPSNGREDGGSIL